MRLARALLSGCDVCWRGVGFGCSPILSISGTGVTGYTNPCASSPSSSCDSTIVATVTIDASTPANSQETITVTAGGQNPSGFLPVDTGPGEQNQATAQATTAALVVSILFNNHNLANNATPPCPDSTNSACVVVGQQILLTASVTLNGQPVQLQSQSWDQPPGAITGGYTIDTTTSPPRTGQPVAMPGTGNCQTFQGNCLMFYWLEAGNGSVTRTINYHYTIPGQSQQTVPAIFQVTAPTNVAVNVPTGLVNIAASSPVNNAGAQIIYGGQKGNAGIIFSPSLTPPQGPYGSNSEIDWVQIRSGNNMTNLTPSGNQYCKTASFLAPQNGGAADGDPSPALDTSFPYLTNPTAVPNQTIVNDNPYVALAAGNAETKAGESFVMSLMWDPALPNGCSPWGLSGNTTIATGCTSIPIPLGTVSWSYGCDAINSLVPQPAPNGTTWIAGCVVPQQAGNLAFVPSNSFPVWTHAVSTSASTSYTCKGTPFN